ncbi:hypothetical protein KKH14_02385 [Patescibacteria group bacterium]|nr:hypothetical protein [Patescibacteria group bacterium]
MKRQILVTVWQNIITPREALDELTDYLIRDQEEQILEVLEEVRKKSLTVNKAEEEIKWILNHETELCQTN